MNNLMNSFGFILPTRIEYGIGALALLPRELEKLNVKRVVMVTDHGIQQAGLVDRVVNLLKQNGMGYTIFADVDPNPKDYNVSAGARVVREFNGQAIVALGGGSPIDCAKAIGVLATHGGDSIKAYEGKTAVHKEITPLITIPTTSGTGSEVTFSSVITDTANNFKMTVKNPLMAAKVALIDPELTLTMPPAVTASTGLDALTHAIEAYTANVAEPISDALALYAVELIYNNLKTAVYEGNNLEARAGMMMGSLLAGLAFSHSDVASVHCIAEALGGVFDTPHGVGNSILLPYVMEYNMEYSLDRYANIARMMGANFLCKEEGAKKAVEMVKQLTKDVKLPSFRSLGIDPRDFERLAEMSARNISTESNPRPMNKENYLEVINNAYRG
jgi:alcohol dehydrogenase